MRKLVFFTLIAWCLVMCAKHETTTQLVQSDTSVTSTSKVDTSSTIRKQFPKLVPVSGARKLNAPKPKTFIKKDADSYITRCTQNTYVDGWAGLRSCIAGATISKTDAGPEKFGAVGPPGNTNQSWLIPEWHVNSVTGNDSAPCVTSGAPCKTYGQIENRWQTNNPTHQQTTEIIIDTDNPVTDPIDWQPTLAANGAGASIIANTTTFASGNLASVTNTNRSGGQAFQADLGSGASTYVGLEIVNTQAGRDNSIGFVDSIVSGNIALITQPLVFPYDEINNWANGDSFTIQRPVQALISVFKPSSNANGNSASIQNIWVPTTVSNGSTQSILGWAEGITNTAIYIYGTRFDSYTKARNVQYIGSYVNSMQFGSCSLTANGLCGEMTDSVLYGGAETKASMSDMTVDGDAMLHGHATHILESSSELPFTLVGNAYCETTDYAGVPNVIGFYGDVIYNYTSASTSTLYGGCRITGNGKGSWFYNGTQVLSPPPFSSGIILTLDEATTAVAVDPSVVPEQLYPNRTLSMTALEAPVGGPFGTGFGGRAISASTHAGFYDNEQLQGPTNPVPFFVGSDGIGIDASTSQLLIYNTDPFPYNIDAGVTSTNFPTLLFVGTTSFSASPVGWFRSDTVVLTGPNVSAWTDLTGHGYTATPTGDQANVPYVASGGANNLPYLSFPGGASNDGLGAGASATPMALTQPYEIFVVARPVSTVSGEIFDQGAAGIDVTATNTVSWYNTSVNFVVTPGTDYLFDVIANAGASTMTVNGNLAGTGTQTQGSTLFGIGNSWFGGVAWNGFIYELIAFQPPVTSPQKAELDNYFASRYGITIVGASNGQWTPSGTVSTAWTPGTILNGAAATTTVSAANAQLGQPAVASFSSALPTGATLSAQVTANGTVTVTLGNLSGGSITIGAGTVSVILL